jgi:hypothetical protein
MPRTVGPSPNRRSRVSEFKRRLGDPTPLIVGGSPYSAEDLTSRLLHWVVDQTTEMEGERPSQEVTIPVILPGLQTDLRLTRNEFEDMIRPAWPRRCMPCTARSPVAAYRSTMSTGYYWSASSGHNIAAPEGSLGPSLDSSSASPSRDSFPLAASGTP